MTSKSRQRRASQSISFRSKLVLYSAVVLIPSALLILSVLLNSRPIPKQVQNSNFNAPIEVSHPVISATDSESDVNRLSKQLAELQERLTEAESQATHAEKQIVDLRNELEASQGIRATLNQQLDQLADELSSVKAGRQQETMALLGEIDQLQKTSSVYERSVNQLKTRNAELHDFLRDSTRQMKQLQSRQQELQAEVADSKKMLNGTKSHLADYVTATRLPLQALSIQSIHEQLLRPDRDLSDNRLLRFLDLEADPSFITNRLACQLRDPSLQVSDRGTTALEVTPARALAIFQTAFDSEIVDLNAAGMIPWRYEGNSIAYLPQLDQVVVADQGSLRWFAFGSSRPLRSQKVSEFEIVSLMTSEIGNQLIVVDSEGGIFLIDASNQQVTRPGEIPFDSDMNFAVAGGGEQLWQYDPSCQQLTVWSLASDENGRMVKLETWNDVDSWCCHPNQESAFLFLPGGVVQQIDCSTLDVVKSGRVLPVSPIQVVSDRSLLVAYCDHQSLFVVESLGDSFQVRHRFKGVAPPNCMRLAHDSDVLLLGRDDGLYELDLRSAFLDSSWALETQVSSACFDHDSLLLGTIDGELLRVDAVSGALIERRHISGDAIRDIAVFQGLLAVAVGKEIQLWSNDKLILKCYTDNSAIDRIKFRGVNELVALDSAGCLLGFEVNSGSVTQFLDRKTTVVDFDLIASGDLIVLDDAGGISIVEPNKVPARISKVSFRPYRIIASEEAAEAMVVGREGETANVDINSSKVNMVNGPDGREILDLASLNRGRFVATLYSDQVIVRDRAFGICGLRLPLEKAENQPEVSCLARLVIHPRSDLIAMISGDGRIRIWRSSFQPTSVRQANEHIPEVRDETSEQ